MNLPKKFYPERVVPPTDWQKELANSIKNPEELYALLDLLPSDQEHIPKKFPLKVPRAFVQRMQKGNWQDPLLLQVLPTKAETLAMAGYQADPLNETSYNAITGLLHKYQSRVLLTLTGACAVHCRYCFRQHFDYAGNTPNTKQMAAIIDYINQNTQINEVLLSGGDPLSLSNKKLSLWLKELASIPHIHTIRLHTRLPVVLPNRIDQALLESLAELTKNVVMVLHINHANEIDQTLKEKCRQLRAAGVTLLNQTVLLKNINDDAQTLTQLSHALFDAQILPYYLHVLDKVQGAAHFDLPLKTAVDLYWQLLKNLPGYLVPKLVQELPDHPHKTPIDIYAYKNHKI